MKERTSSFDVLKVIAAFFVVYIHIPTSGTIGGMLVPVTRVAVPFFIMVSGYFIWNANMEIMRGKIKKQVKYILFLTIFSNLMFFVWGIVKSILFTGSVSGYFKQVFSLDSLISFLVFNASPFSTHLWYLSSYLYVLLLCYVFCNPKFFRIGFYLIVFNYTGIFENLVGKLCDSNMKYMGSSRTSSGPDAANYLGEVAYAHGKLNKSPLIFGVDNKDQVANKQFLQTEDFTYSLIKPEANANLLSESQRKCFELITGSSIICIFGMSIGLTDMTWWKKISEWLMADANHHLIQYARDEVCIRNSSGSYDRAQRSYRHYLNERLLLTEEQGKQLSSQIHIDFNRDLFGVEDFIKPSLDYIDLPKVRNRT